MSRRVYPCAECSLPDLHNGDGDGIGSCMCPRCEHCGGPPGLCNCASDVAYYDEYGWPEEYWEPEPYEGPAGISSVRTVLDGPGDAS